MTRAVREALRRARPVSAKQSGFAVIMVVLVLASLLVVAYPFLVSMKQHEAASRRSLAQTQARLAARGARNHAVAMLYRTNFEFERTNTQAPYNSPYYDGMEELHPPPYDFYDRSLPGMSRSPFAKKEGVIASAMVQDEQGKVNLNTASPMLIGSLLAATELRARITATQKKIPVTQTMHFPQPVRPGRIAGYLLIGGEVVAYRNTSSGAFLECRRGVAGTRASEHRKGSVVVDGRGFFVQRMRLENGGDSIGSMGALRALNVLGFEGASISQDEFDRLLSMATVHSYLPPAKRWGRPIKVLGKFPLKDSRRIQVAGAGRQVSAGSIVKIWLGSRTREIRRVVAVHGREIVLDEALQYPYLEGATYLSHEARHTVNLNTARPEVLRALFTGLSISGRDIAGIAESKAQAVADAIVQARPVKGPGDLRIVLNRLAAGQILTSTDVSAILQNGASPFCGRLSASTVPYAYRSFDVFTVMSSAVVNSPAGEPLGEHHVREIVKVVPPVPMEWVLQTQRDFHEAIQNGASSYVVTAPNPMFTGIVSPDGGTKDGVGDVRLRTRRVLPDARTTFLAHFDEGEGDAAMAAASVSKGMRSYTGTVNAARCLNAEGILIRHGDRLSYQTSGNVAMDHDGLVPGALSFWFQPVRWQSDIYYLFDSGHGRGVTLRNENGEEFTTQGAHVNRLSVYYDGGAKELVCLLADPALPEFDPDGDESFTYAMVSERLRVPLGGMQGFDFSSWHHITFAWLGGVRQHEGQTLVVFLDGRRVRDYSPLGDIPDGDMSPESLRERPLYAPMTRLREPLEEDDDEIPVYDASDFPLRGVLLLKQVDEEGVEVIEYAERSDTGFSHLRRAARNTSRLDFSEDDSVRLYGYHARLLSYLPPASETVAADLGIQRESKLIQKIAADQTSITVQNARDFQDSGFVSIDKKEDVYYGSKNGNTLEDCIRGLHGTTPRSHQANAKVQFKSLEVSGYERFYFLDDDPPEEIAAKDPDAAPLFPRNTQWHFGIVQTGAEWILFRMKEEMNGRYYLIGEGDMWNMGATRPRAHAAGDFVLPVVMVDAGGAGHADIITMHMTTEGHSISGKVMHGAQVRQANARYFVGLTEIVDALYGPHNRTMLLKFPSGVLPTRLGKRIVLGANAIDDTSWNIQAGDYPADAVMDEVHMQQFGRNRVFEFFVDDETDRPLGLMTISDVRGWPAQGMVTIRDRPLAYDGIMRSWDGEDDELPVISLDMESDYPCGGIGLGETEILLDDADALEDSGYVLIDDEIIYYGSFDDDALKGCRRGVSDTRIAHHCAGTPVRPISGKITLLPGDLLESDEWEDVASGVGYLGTVRVSSTLKQECPGDAQELYIGDTSGFPPEGYVRIDDEYIAYQGRSEDALLAVANRRGRFGTAVATHASGSVVSLMPARYDDRRGVEEGERAFFHASKMRNGVHWRAIHWKDALPDGRDLPASLAVEVLVRFDGAPDWDTEPSNAPGGIYRFTHGGAENALNVTADELEVRVFFRYLEGAAVDASWLYTPVLDSMTVEYGGVTTVLASEETMF